MTSNIPNTVIHMAELTVDQNWTITAAATSSAGSEIS